MTQNKSMTNTICWQSYREINLYIIYGLGVSWYALKISKYLWLPNDFEFPLNGVLLLSY
jgi:hypothetical protein